MGRDPAFTPTGLECPRSSFVSCPVILDPRFERHQRTRRPDLEFDGVVPTRPPAGRSRRESLGTLVDPESARIERRYLSAVVWCDVQREIARGLPSGRLPVDSAFVMELVPITARRSVRVQCVSAEPVNADAATLAARLDAMLAAVTERSAS
jgi:hypothetical protein